MQGEATMLLFAHSDDNYMARSERRASYNRAPRRRRRRPGGFIYGLVAIIVSIIIWPLGMVMLWARRLKWSAGVKLIASALTLILCMCWIGFALTVQTGDSRVTYIQDRVNGFLADSVGVVTERGEKLADDVAVAGGELLTYAADNLPAAAGWTNDTIHAGWEAVAGLFGGENDDRIAPVDADVTATPEPSGEPEPTVTPEITDEPTPTPEPEITPEATAGEPTAEPSEEPTAEPAPTVEPVEVAEGTPAPARVTVQPTQLNIEADPTPAPTVKPAGEATVYHSSNGKCYHMAANCIGMTGAPAHTLADSIADGFRSCGNCDSPDAEILSAEELVVWLDESNIYHTSDECPNFNGVWSLVTITDACAADAAACSACGASYYAPEDGRIAEMQSLEPTEAPTAEPTEEPTAEPTEEPTAEPTEEPTAEPTEAHTAEPTEAPTAEPTEAPTAEPTEAPTAEPTEAPTAEPTEEPTPEPTIDVSALSGVKSAGEATVYYTTNGVAYHRAATCVGMSGAKAHTLSEAVAAGYRACGNCQVPAEELLSADEPVLWVDEAGVFHVTDECAQFNGEWTLMTVTDAYAAGCTPCAVCCIPDAASPEATAGPTVEPSTDPTAGPTVEPTVEPADGSTPAPGEEGAVAHKSAGEAIVYHTSNGRSYHVAERCGSMSGAKPYTLAESIADGYGPCGICDVPDPDILDMPVVWLDAAGMGHLSDECARFEGRYILMSIYDACSEDVTGCPYCGGESYIAENRARLMELAKSVTVYYNDGSTYYHTADSCKGMPTADAHTLYDAIEKGLEWCKNCEPVKLGDLDSE